MVRTFVRKPSPSHSASSRTDSHSSSPHVAFQCLRRDALEKVFGEPYLPHQAKASDGFLHACHTGPSGLRFDRLPRRPVRPLRVLAFPFDGYQQGLQPRQSFPAHGLEGPLTKAGFVRVDSGLDEALRLFLGRGFNLEMQAPLEE